MEALNPKSQEVGEPNFPHGAATRPWDRSGFVIFRGRPKKTLSLVGFRV